MGSVNNSSHALSDMMKRYKHGGSNHHEAANYNLSREYGDGGSLYKRKRYSTSVSQYRRGGELKNFKTEGEVNLKKEVKGYGGRNLYDGPLKEMTVHNFFQFSNEDGSPNLSFRPEWITGKDKDGNAVLDPEVMKWRSKNRGLSVDELLNWYMWTQLSIPPSAHSNHSDGSTWQDNNYGKIKQVATGEDGRVKMDMNGFPMFEEFSQEKHNDFLNKAKNGEQGYSWYPTNNKDAFAMARDIGMPYYFYDGEPKITAFQSEIDEMQAKQESANMIAQDRWFKHHSTNPSVQFNTWLSTKKDGEYDRMKLSDLTEASLVYAQVNNPELLEYIDPDFENEEDALSYLNTNKNNVFGGAVTVKGKNFLLGEGNYNYKNNDITGKYYDANSLDYTMMLDKEYKDYVESSKADNYMGPEEWNNEYDHSDYKANFIKVNEENYIHAIESNTGNFSAQKVRDGYDQPIRTVGVGQDTYKLNDKEVKNPLVQGYTPTGPQGLESTISLNNVVSWVTGAHALKLVKPLATWGVNSVFKGGVDATKKIWQGTRHPFRGRTFTNGAWQATKNTAATAFQPLKFAGDTYTKSWLNKTIMNPAIPGTYGVANLNTAANVGFAYDSGSNAIEDFSNGDYFSGAINTAFTGLNAYTPYARLKKGLAANKFPTDPQPGITTEGGYIPFKNPEGMSAIFSEANKLPPFSLRNTMYNKLSLSKNYPNLFPQKYTQKDFVKSFNGAADNYNSTNNVPPMEQTLLKYSSK